MEFKKICVIGLGYIGLPTASTFANHGLQVIGMDANPDAVVTLPKAGLYIHEPCRRALVQTAITHEFTRLGASTAKPLV